MKAPGLTPGLVPECPCGHAVGSSADRRLVAIGLVLVGAPLVFGAVGSVMVADEALGPAITFAVWLAMFAIRVARSKGSAYFAEWFAVVGCLVTLQLLLDLHTRYLGDLVIAGLHASFAIALLVGALRHRRAR
jgi:hypothetical protein